MDKEHHVNFAEYSPKQCCENHLSAEHSYALKVLDKVKLSTNQKPIHPEHQFLQKNHSSRKRQTNENSSSNSNSKISKHANSSKEHNKILLVQTFYQNIRKTFKICVGNLASIMLCPRKMKLLGDGRLEDKHRRHK